MYAYIYWCDLYVQSIEWGNMAIHSSIRMLLQLYVPEVKWAGMTLSVMPHHIVIKFIWL